MVTFLTLIAECTIGVDVPIQRLGINGMETGLRLCSLIARVEENSLAITLDCDIEKLLELLCKVRESAYLGTFTSIRATVSLRWSIS